MSLRELATASDVCTPADDGAGPSNALSSFTNTLLGRSTKHQERLREVTFCFTVCLLSARFVHPRSLRTDIFLQYIEPVQSDIF